MPASLRPLIQARQKPMGGHAPYHPEGGGPRYSTCQCRWAQVTKIWVAYAYEYVYSYVHFNIPNPTYP